MTDVHSGIPHDLPEYEPDTDPLPTRWRVQLYRGTWGWNWGHQCSPTVHKDGHSYLTWRMALRYANLHAERCCR